MRKFMKSKSFFISFMLISSLLCFAYALPIGAANISVTSVLVSPTSETLTVGTTKTIIATVSPSNATNKNVTWLSSSTAVATVSSVGVVTGKSGGNATIICKTIDGNKTATCLVTVVVPAASVSVSPTSATITAVSIKTIIPTVLPLNATNKSVTWSSSDTAVATVSAFGVVTGISTGSATITCTTADGTKTATCTITVPPVFVTDVSVSPTNASITTGTTKTIIATVSPSNAANKSLEWSSSDTAVATVSTTGVITGVSVGSATITCKTADGNKTATCAVTVPPISVTGVLVSSTSETTAVGTTKTIIATVSPSNATDKSVIWSSSNTAVATVSTVGVVLAKSGGNATITCKSVDGNKRATCLVTVALPPASISVSPTSASITAGTTKTIIATVLPLNATNKSVTWSSSDTAIATVSDTGFVTAKSIGNAIITCTATDGDKTAACNITITDDLIVYRPRSTMFVQVAEEVRIHATSNSASKITFRLDNKTPFELTKSGTSFSMNWTPGDAYKYEALEVDGNYIGFKKYIFKTNNNTTLSGDYAILMFPKESYQLAQPTLDWSSPTATPFLAPFSPEYNCLAHSINVLNLWYDEDSNNGPEEDSLPEITKFMLKQPPYDTRIGTAYTQTCAVTEYPLVIYYESFHFAKATSWNSNGTPKTIEYKMGESELVGTSGYDIFTDETYGKPELYFK